MSDKNNGEFQGGGSGDHSGQEQPQVIRAGQRAPEMPGEVARQTEEATRQVLRAGADMLSQAGQKAQTEVGIGESPEVKQALQEWAGYAGRTMNRNCRALSDLMQCRTVGQVMGRQAELLMSNYHDWLRTSMAVMQVAGR